MSSTDTKRDYLRREKNKIWSRWMALEDDPKFDAHDDLISDLIDLIEDVLDDPQGN